MPPVTGVNFSYVKCRNKADSRFLAEMESIYVPEHRPVPTWNGVLIAGDLLPLMFVGNSIVTYGCGPRCLALPSRLDPPPRHLSASITAACRGETKMLQTSYLSRATITSVHQPALLVIYVVCLVDMTIQAHRNRYSLPCFHH